MPGRRLRGFALGHRLGRPEEKGDNRPADDQDDDEAEDQTDAQADRRVHVDVLRLVAPSDCGQRTEMQSRGSLGGTDAVTPVAVSAIRARAWIVACR